MSDFHFIFCKLPNVQVCQGEKIYYEMETAWDLSSLGSIYLIFNIPKVYFHRDYFSPKSYFYQSEKITGTK